MPPIISNPSISLQVPSITGSEQSLNEGFNFNIDTERTSSLLTSTPTPDPNSISSGSNPSAQLAINASLGSMLMTQTPKQTDKTKQTEKVSEPPENALRDRIAQSARNSLGKHAGVSNMCAYSVRDIMKSAGVNLPVTSKPWDNEHPTGEGFANGLAGPEVGRKLKPDEKPQVGDLVFFTGTPDNRYGAHVITHVGVVVGHDKDGTPMMVDHSRSRGMTERPVDSIGGRITGYLRPKDLEPK